MGVAMTSFFPWIQRWNTYNSGWGILRDEGSYISSSGNENVGSVVVYQSVDRGQNRLPPSHFIKYLGQSALAFH